MTTPEPIADTLVDPMLLELRDCLFRELGRTRYGYPCRSYVTHSFGPPLDDGCTCTCEVTVDGIPVTANGDGRVRLVQMLPDVVETFGPTPQACPAGWQAIIELSTSRCIPTSDDEEPLPAETMTDTALRLGDDRAALMRVLACCGALVDRDISVQQVAPVGPQGGCAGWMMQLVIALPGGPAGGC